MMAIRKRKKDKRVRSTPKIQKCGASGISINGIPLEIIKKNININEIDIETKKEVKEIKGCIYSKPHKKYETPRVEDGPVKIFNKLEIAKEYGMDKVKMTNAEKILYAISEEQVGDLWTVSEITKDLGINPKSVSPSMVDIFNRMSPDYIGRKQNIGNNKSQFEYWKTTMCKKLTGDELIIIYKSLAYKTRRPYKPKTKKTSPISNPTIPHKDVTPTPDPALFKVGEKNVNLNDILSTGLQGGITINFPENFNFNFNLKIEIGEKK